MTGSKFPSLVRLTRNKIEIPSTSVKHENKTKGSYKNRRPNTTKRPKLYKYELLYVLLLILILSIRKFVNL